MSDVQDSPPDFSCSGAVEYRPVAARSSTALEALLAREEPRLLSILGVTSVGIGLGPAGTKALVVGVVDAGVATHLPSQIEGVPVVVNVSGPVDALRRR